MTELKETIDALLNMRHNIHILMDDSKKIRANGKFFAYKKCYIMLSGIIHPLNEKLPDIDRRSI